MLKTIPHSISATIPSKIETKQVHRIYRQNLQSIAVLSYQEILALHSTGDRSELKVIAQLKRTIRVCQKEIAQQRQNAYQSRRNAMRQRRPI